MQVSLIKKGESFDDFYGISIIAENPKEKNTIRKLSNSSFTVVFNEKTSYNLTGKKVTIQINLENTE